MISVIEVSCGEYGDNVKTLVNAINNGKYDIREGCTLPQLKESMNNCTATKEILKSTDTIKDKNDITNVEEKYSNEKTLNDISNGKFISGYAVNDITKQGIIFMFFLKFSLFTRNCNITMICSYLNDLFYPIFSLYPSNLNFKK